ncbi:glucosamine inositolphosphorylceramide transferase family protein [Parabacteroides leei]
MSFLSKLLYDTVYAVAYRKNGVSESYRVIDTNWRYWYADPILFQDGDNLWLFVERMDRIRHKGVISVSKYENGKFGKFQDVLEEKFHLSYPMIFKKDDSIYMIPETADSGKVILYKSSAFPKQWKQHRVLLEDCRNVDTNVFFFEGHWYLLTCEMDATMGAYTRLKLYGADNIENGIINPIDTYNSNSIFKFDCRGGGQIYFKDDKCYRPVQCGDESTYGKSLRIDNIKISNGLLISNKEFNINPEGININKHLNITGTHTYGQCDDIELIDIKISTMANPIVQTLKIMRKLLYY